MDIDERISELVDALEGGLSEDERIIMRRVMAALSRFTCSVVHEQWLREKKESEALTAVG